MIGTPMSLNDVCVFVPAWFGVVATTFLALLASECAVRVCVCVCACVCVCVCVCARAVCERAHILVLSVFNLIYSFEQGFASAGVAAALVMSIIPAHIMRSVAGGTCVCVLSYMLCVFCVCVFCVLCGCVRACVHALICCWRYLCRWTQTRINVGILFYLHLYDNVCKANPHESWDQIRLD